jgi:hypothetical protein
MVSLELKQAATLAGVDARSAITHRFGGGVGGGVWGARLGLRRKPWSRRPAPTNPTRGGRRKSDQGSR